MFETFEKEPGVWETRELSVREFKQIDAADTRCFSLFWTFRDANHETLRRNLESLDKLNLEAAVLQATIELVRAAQVGAVGAAADAHAEIANGEPPKGP